MVIGEFRPLDFSVLISLPDEWGGPSAVQKGQEPAKTVQHIPGFLDIDRLGSGQFSTGQKDITAFILQLGE